MLPTRLRVGSLVSVVLYALIAMKVLDRAGQVETPLPDDYLRVATWVVAGYFLLGIGLHLASRSRRERAVMSPLVVLQCLLTTVVAVG